MKRIAICFLLMAGVASGLVLIPKNEITTYAATDGNYVRHLEADLYNVGNILFSDDSAMKTTNGITTSLVTGSARSTGYQNGIGNEARFYFIYDFYQISPNQVIIVDSINHCLRSTDRTTNRTDDYAGICTKRGDTDGPSGSFSAPISILLDVKNPSRFIIAEIEALRSLDIHSKSLSTLRQRQTPLLNTRNMIQEKSTGNLYLSGYNQISYFNFKSNTLTLILGGSNSWFTNIKFLNEHTLLLTDFSNHLLKVLNLGSNTSSTICSGTRGHESGNFTSCSLSFPSSLLILNNTLFIGENQRIRSVTGEMSRTSPIQVTSTTPSPTTPTTPSPTTPFPTTPFPTTPTTPSPTTTSPTTPSPTTTSPTTPSPTTTSSTASFVFRTSAPDGFLRTNGTTIVFASTAATIHHSSSAATHVPTIQPLIPIEGSSTGIELTTESPTTTAQQSTNRTTTEVPSSLTELTIISSATAGAVVLCTLIVGVLVIIVKLRAKPSIATQVTSGDIHLQVSDTAPVYEIPVAAPYNGKDEVYYKLEHANNVPVYEIPVDVREDDKEENYCQLDHVESDYHIYSKPQ